MALVKPKLGDDVLQTDIDQTEEINNLINIFYPVGTIYESTNSTNPNEFMGGTWERYGNGRVTVGLDTAQTEFNSVGKTGGTKTHTLTIAQLPSHRHDFKQGSGSAGSVSDSYKNIWQNGDGREGATSQTLHRDRLQGVQATGGGEAHNNLQPYITVYRFRRTA